MPVNEDPIGKERQRWLKRWAGRNRAAAALFVLLVLDTGSALMKIGRAYKLAAAMGMSLEQALALLWMRNSVRIGQTFTGAQVVFIDYSVSACVYLCSALFVGLVLKLNRRDIRRQATVWNYISELEHRTREQPSN